MLVNTPFIGALVRQRASRNLDDSGIGEGCTLYIRRKETHRNESADPGKF